MKSYKIQINGPGEHVLYSINQMMFIVDFIL